MTFGVGGIGEYVDNTTISMTATDTNISQQECNSTLDTTHNHHQNNKCLRNNSNTSSNNAVNIDNEFTVTTNAVLVHTATPLALARAVYHLISQPESVRMSLGQRGRNTIQSYFHIERQMSQYRAFYIQLINQYKSFINSTFD